MAEVSLGSDCFLMQAIFHHLGLADNCAVSIALNVEPAATYHGAKMTVYRAAKLCHYQFKPALALLLGTKQQSKSFQTHQTRRECQEYKSAREPK